jgi:putative oxidoreductase
MINKAANLAGRLLLAQIFLIAGVNKLSAYAPTQGYMEAMGVPGALLPLVIVLELGGAIALIAGWKTQWAAIALAGFSVVSAMVFHAEFSDQTQMIMFMKNLAVAGGLLVLAGVRTEETFSIDSRGLHASRAV